MPKKGDNYDLVTANAVADHLNNATATYRQLPQDSSHSVGGIFGNTLIDINGVEGFRKTFSCLTSDVPTLSKRDEITINGDAYGVKSFDFLDPYRVLIVLSEFD